MHGKISHSLKQMARQLEREITTVFCLQSEPLHLIVFLYFWDYFCHIGGIGGCKTHETRLVWKMILRTGTGDLAWEQVTCASSQVVWSQTLKTLLTLEDEWIKLYQHKYIQIFECKESPDSTDGRWWHTMLYVSVVTHLWDNFSNVCDCVVMGHNWETNMIYFNVTNLRARTKLQGFRGFRGLLRNLTPAKSFVFLVDHEIRWWMRLSCNILKLI